MTANKSYHKLDNILITSISNFIKKDHALHKYYNFTYSTQTHTLYDILDGIIEIVKYGKPYRSSKTIPKSTLNDAYSKLITRGIIINTYIDLLNKYLKKSPNKKLKCIFTDTTCIVNKYGSEDAKYFGHKKRVVTKVSFECLSDGIPIKVMIANGSSNDSKIFKSQLKQPYLCNQLVVNKNKKYYIADSLYDGKENINLLISNNFIPLIKSNPKNTKDKKLLKKKKMSAIQFKIYKKRFNIEIFNGLIKSFRRIQTRYDKNSNIFLNTIIVGCIYRILYNMEKIKF